MFCSFFSGAQTGPAGIQSSVTNVFWVKADAGTSSTVNATSISSWNDQSGNGINVSQATANQQPSFATNVMNSQPAVRFDDVNSTNDKLTASDNALLDNTTGYSFFMVTRPENADNNARCVISKRTAVGVDQSFMQFFYTGSTFYTDIQTNNDRYNTGMTFAANTNYIITQQFDGSLAAASRCRTYVQSSLNITSSETSTLVPDNNSSLVLGSTDAADNRPFGGYIAELIIYRSALQAAPRIIVENYLSAKYNITLLSNDKYAGDNAGNGDYDRQVAGVGQESSGSSLSFSPSVSGGMGLTVSSGLDNGDYVLAGHASPSNSAIITDVGGMSGLLNSRWQRVWYIDVTNASTNIGATINFDLSDAGLSTSTLGIVSNYVVLYRAGQTGNWTELATATSTTGDNIVFSGITLTNDGYYTLGTKHYEISPLPLNLIYYEAGIKNDLVLHHWLTTNERNSSHFIIEQSFDGILFSPCLQVRAKVNCEDECDYLSTSVINDKELTYYRLQCVDADQSFKYSPIVVVRNEGSFDISLFPQPASERVYIKLNREAAGGPIEFEIRDLNGSLLLATRETSSATVSLDVARLNTGLYLLSIKAGNLYKTLKLFIK